MERNIYLSNTDLEEAVLLYLERLAAVGTGIGTDQVDIREAGGRVTAAPVIAKLSSPNHNAAAMDGIMVISDSTFSANEANPVILNKGRDFEYINTGHVVTEPYDSVIMIEDVVVINDEQVKIMVQAAPWQHIRPIGEDIVAGEMILPENHLIRPMDIGAVLSGGVTEITVFEKVRVGIIPTGTEITDDYESLTKGKIFDTNSWTFRTIVEELGGIPERISPVEDDYEKLKKAVLELTNRNHMVIINAGSSAGSKDFTARLVEDLGELVLHGIAIKPGKPTILGLIEGKPVIGVPGYPGSAFLVFEEIVSPVIRALQKRRTERQPMAKAVVSRRIVSTLKFREYIRVKLGKVGEKLIATPLNRGAGVTMALVKADGILVIPKNSEGYEAGEEAPVELVNDMGAIENTIVSIGSHDLIMDYIGSILARKGQTLSSAHVGSMGGIMAIKRGEAHMAPVHLMDEDTGEYNRTYIERYLAKEGVVLVKGVKREQGLMVANGNPKNILGITDLKRSGIQFVNRQKGSGTRILTDYLLRKNGIDTKEIRGYDRDMTTHMAVAAAVDSGTADAGIGVSSAARAMGLDFISIGFEEYDFIIPEQYMDTEMIRNFLEVLRSSEFERILKELGGYGI